MKRVLMVSPHFPPDNGAATHRLRLLAPHLAEFGWVPTVVTVDPRDYEGRLDPDLLAMVPPDLMVVRIRAWSPKWTRMFLFGDLGLRSLFGLWRACKDLQRDIRFDCVFVTIYPSYTALLGRLVKKRARIPFVLDYQDPWVGAWGLTTGPGAAGTPDLKSRLSRALAQTLEPIAVRAADALTAVSAATLDDVRERIPSARTLPCVEIPVGAEERDFEFVASRPRTHGLFDGSDGKLHVSYVGTLLPLGHETLRAFLQALALLKDRDFRLYSRLSIHFVGTSNQTIARSSGPVLPEAERIGVADAVHEVPSRVDYLDALELLSSSAAILLLGSSERHYTASKIYPALLAGRPLLALFHRESTVVPILRKTVSPGSLRLVTYDEERPVATKVEEIYGGLRLLVEGTGAKAAEIDSSALDEYSARSLARRLASVFTDVVSRRA